MVPSVPVGIPVVPSVPVGPGWSRLVPGGPGWSRVVPGGPERRSERRPECPSGSLRPLRALAALSAPMERMGHEHDVCNDEFPIV